jgi:hypothetical protein
MKLIPTIALALLFPTLALAADSDKSSPTKAVAGENKPIDPSLIANDQLRETVKAAERNKLCGEQIGDAFALMVTADTVLQRKPLSADEATRANAAASLGLLKLKLAEQMGCPKLFTPDQFKISDDPATKKQGEKR